MRIKHTATRVSNIRHRSAWRFRERRRKAALTWFGLAVTYDAGISFLERAKQLRDKAGARGEQVRRCQRSHFALKDKVAGTMEERRVKVSPTG